MASSRQQNDKKLGGFSRNFSTKCCFTSRNRLQPDSDIYNVSERGLTRKHLLVNVLLHWRHICICAGLLGLGLSSSPKSTLFICWLQNAGLECCTLGNIFLAVIFLLVVNQLIELYQFRNMPPGPRLTSLPLIGNLLSFDSGGSLREATARFVIWASSFNTCLI